MFLLMSSLSPHLLDPAAPTHPHRANPAAPATASIHVHVVRDGELCPHGGEGHIPALLPLWSPNLFHEKISLQICCVGEGRSSPAHDSRRWSGSSAAAGPRLLGGGTSPEPMVVGEDECWRCRGRASGTSGRTARTGGRAAGEGGAACEPVSSAVGRHGVGPGRRRTGEGEAGRASRKRHTSRAEEDRHGRWSSGCVGRRQWRRVG
jgi:hypothetical protein